MPCAAFGESCGRETGTCIALVLSSLPSITKCRVPCWWQKLVSAAGRVSREGGPHGVSQAQPNEDDGILDVACVTPWRHERMNECVKRQALLQPRPTTGGWPVSLPSSPAPGLPRGSRDFTVKEGRMGGWVDGWMDGWME